MPIRSAQDYLSEPPVHVNKEVDSAAVNAAATPPSEPSITDDIGNDLKDTAVGFGQGLTYGGGTKALAAMQASYDLLTGNDKKSKWDDLYTKHRDENEKSVAESEARSKYLTHGAEAVGAVLSPINEIAAPVAGLAGLGEATGVLGGLARGATEGAALGGAAGAINTEPGDNMPHSALMGALKGASFGAVGGAASGAIPGAISGLKKLAYKPGTEYGETGAAMLDLGKSGQGVSTKGDLATIRAANDQAAGDATRALLPAKTEPGAVGPLSQREMISNEYDKVLASHADANGNSLPLQLPNAAKSSTAALDDFVNDHPQSFSGPEGDLFKKRLDDMLSGNISAEDAHALKLSIYGDPLAKEAATANTFQNAAGEINSTLNKNVDGYQQVNKDWENHNQLLESLNGVPTDLNQKYASQSPSLNNTVFNQFKNTINGAGGTGTSELQTKSNWDNFNKTASNIANKNPDFIEKYGQFLPQLQKDIQNKAIVQGGVNVIQGKGQLGAIGDFAGNFAPRPASYQLNNVAGQMINGANQGWQKSSGFFGGIGGAYNNIVSQPYSKLKSIADSLSNSPGTKQLGSSLNTALTNPVNNMSRTAALFNIMQNPNSRKLVGGDQGTGENNGQ